MRTSLIPCLGAVILLFTISLHAQQECRVLLPGIAGKYTGECKKGLAEGTGTASGTDSYTGSFRKGLPDGEGTYTWATGAVYAGHWKKGMRDGYGTFTFPVNEKDSIQAGYWSEDAYVGKEQLAPYVIQHRIGVTRASFLKQGKGESYVSFKFARSGNTSYNVEDLIMQGSSGEESIATAFTGFQHTSFPFEGKIQFKAPNLLESGMYNYEMRFVINHPGDWLITVYY